MMVCSWLGRQVMEQRLSFRVTLVVLVVQGSGMIVAGINCCSGPVGGGVTTGLPVETGDHLATQRVRALGLS